MADGLVRARDCYARRAWREAYDGFLGQRDVLGADDLERLAVSAYLVGSNRESDAAWGRAHRRHLESDDVGGAVRCAFWLGFRLVNAAEWPEANAWIARIERLVSATADGSLVRGRLDYLTGLRAAFEGDLGTAAADLERTVVIATRRSGRGTRW